MEAADVYLKWAKKSPKKSEIWTKIGDIYKKLDRPDEAGKFYMIGVARGKK